MSRIQITWVIKTAQGQVKGPYSTEAVLRMIGEGVFSGEELISKLPDGQWTRISKETAFYDKLLQTLESTVDHDPLKAQRMEAETVIRKPTPQTPLVAENKVKGTDIKIAPQVHKIDVLEAPQEIAMAQFPGQAPKVLGKVAGGVDPSVIDLSNIGTIQKKEIARSLKFPLIILFLAIGLVIFAFLPDEKSTEDKIHLLAPGKSVASFSEADVKTKLNEALFAMEQDTFESYLTAQNKLVAIVEGAPMNLEVRALLCVTYKQLWPFAKQDAQDIRTIASVTQSTRAINVISPFGQVCEAVKLLTGGRYREARSVIEGALEGGDRFSLLPILYSYKGELLEGDHDLDNAIPYFEKASQLWEKWLRPQVELGKTMMKKNKFPEAAAYFRQVVGKNPNHREAKLLMGVLEYRGFHKTDLAHDTLSSAIQLTGRVPQIEESDAYHVFAEILVMRNDKKKALAIAQKGFALNPNNSDLRQLVIRLGGSDKIKSDKSTNNELLFLGDQYVRQGDHLAAQAEFKAAFEIDPKNGTAAMKAAKSLWLLNQSFEAIDWLGKAIKAEPTLVAAYVLQADYMSQRFDFAGATKALTNATKIAPNSYEVLRGLALLEFRKNNMQGAIAFGQRSMKVFDGDIDAYILLAKANAILAQAIVPINKKEIERKETAAKDAIRFATKATEIDATNPEAQVTYSKTLAQINGVDSAITYLQELIKRFSYTDDYKIALAEVYKMEDRYSQCREIYERIVDADPRSKKAWLGLGESYKALGLNDRSLKAFLTAAVIDPTDGEALFQAGKLYLETSRFEEAIQQFKRVQRLNPNYPRTHYYIGKAAFMSGDFNTAQESAKKEKSLNPNLADAYILTAEVFAARRQFGECAAEYSQAMKLRPQGADIYVKSAQCYRQSGALDVAEDMLALASSRESGYADIYKEQGAVYELRGDVRSAAQAYNKYLGLSPNTPDRGEIERKLSTMGN